jgi:hypothetical protein
MRTGFPRRRGASLTEVVTASTVFMLLLGGVVGIGVQASNGWARGTSQVMADDAASSALQAITRDVRDGVSCVVGSSGAEITVTMPLVNSQGDFDRFETGDQVRYYLSSGKLYRQAGITSARVLARNVTSIRFQDLGGRISVEITSQRQSGNRTSTTRLTTQISLRNEPVS